MYFFVAFVPMMIGVFAAVVFMLTPLQPVSVLGTPVAWCGPGATSDSAVEVLWNPAVVNEPGGLPIDSSKDMLLESFCLGQAHDRMTGAAIVFFGGSFTSVLLGFGLAVSLWLRESKVDEDVELNVSTEWPW